MKPTATAATAVAAVAASAVLIWPQLDGLTAPDRDTRPASIEGLTVASDLPMDGYDRDAFGDWTSQGSGCDTREIVLRQQATPGTYVAGKGCRAIEGEWISRYTGTTVTDSSDVDIDHVVPLAEAWRSGAATWPDELRETFANDTTRPQLWAVDASSNRSKGDQDPTTWLPGQDVCGYAQAWLAVKTHYQLSIDPAEHRALSDALATCTQETP